ncbi:60S ribosomal protein L12 [Binucleata daphniae]
MSNKPSTDEYKYITIKVIGGEVPGAVLSTKVGPLGIPAKVVGEDIKKATAEYKGLRVNVRLAIKDRKATVEVTPSTSSLIIKALKEPVRDRKKEKNITHNGTIKMTEVIEIARIKAPMSQSKSLTGVVKSVLGTCLSVGCNIDGKSPKEVIREINEEVIIIPEK